MSWSEVKLLKDRLNTGTRALPLLIIEDVFNNLGGKTLTITNGAYTHTVGFPQGESILPITLECLGDWSVSYTDNGNTVTEKVTVDKVGGVTFSFLKIVSWSSGSDSEIVDMVTAADKGIITLSDYWNVGDERTVHLDAMSATGVGESHVAQDVTFVLMNQGGKTLTNATESGRTECSFITGMKDSLKEKGYMNSTHTNIGGWTSSARRTWCNNVFKNALPSTLSPIFKQFQNKTSAGNQSTTINTDNDWFALSSEVEVSNTTTRSVPGEGTQFTWYETSSNRIKKTDGTSAVWWGRSPHPLGSDSFAGTNSNGVVTSDGASVYSSISPFGVI